jgi:hypothetical protein
VVASGAGDVLGGTFTGCSVSRGQGDFGAGAGERASGLNAEAGCRAGDHDATTGQVDAGCDLCGGAGKAEGGCDGTHRWSPRGLATIVDDSDQLGRSRDAQHLPRLARLPALVEDGRVIETLLITTRSNERA